MDVYYSFYAAYTHVLPAYCEGMVVVNNISDPEKKVPWRFSSKTLFLSYRPLKSVPE